MQQNVTIQISYLLLKAIKIYNLQQSRGIGSGTVDTGIVLKAQAVKGLNPVWCWAFFFLFPFLLYFIGSVSLIMSTYVVDCYLKMIPICDPHRENRLKRHRMTE